MEVQRFTRGVQVTLDGSGEGDVSLPAVPANRVWRPVSVHTRRVTGSTPYSPAQLQLYIGEPGASDPIDGTYSGDLDTTDNPVPLLFASEWLSARFTNGTAGDIYRVSMMFTEEPA